MLKLSIVKEFKIAIGMETPCSRTGISRAHTHAPSAGFLSLDKLIIVTWFQQEM